jgi:RNA-directed DNA polymerase
MPARCPEGPGDDPPGRQIACPHFAWKRLIRMLMKRHHWNWKDVRRSLVTATSRWRPISAGEVELRPIAAIPITRYRWRGAQIPTPWPAITNT